jgi:hypothetical protein
MGDITRYPRTGPINLPERLKFFMKVAKVDKSYIALKKI